jgi:hypothetical protein
MAQFDSSAVPVGVSRRDLLKRGAVVGAVAAWTIPLVQVVSMTPAHADSPSAPPATPPPNNPPPLISTPPPSSPSHHVGSKTPHAPATTATATATPAAAAPHAGGGALASTGTTTPVGPTVGIGTAAIALGAGALGAAHVLKNRQEKAAAE